MTIYIDYVRGEIEAQEICNAVAERVFTDCQENGYSQALASGYNILISARHYLETGKPMIGNRTHWFFTKDEEESEMERARR